VILPYILYTLAISSSSMKYIIITLILGLLVLGACGQVDDTGSDVNTDTSSDLNPLCVWEQGPCEMILDEGFYFSAESQRCEQLVKGNSGCENPPFYTLTECAAACE
jgi:hypothetical protein